MPAQSDTAPPRGFEMTITENGERLIRYRTSGVWDMAIFFCVFLAVWWSGIYSLTRHIFFDGGDYLALRVLVPMTLAGLGVAAYVIWFFGSVTSFVFGANQLTVEQSLLSYSRRRVFNRREIEAVKQVKDGGEGEDSFATWGLVVITNTSAEVLSRQPIDKSDWLGPFIAQWADVSFEPAQKRK
jgi:hypothetical protein